MVKLLFLYTPNTCNSFLLKTTLTSTGSQRHTHTDTLSHIMLWSLYKSQHISFFHIFSISPILRLFLANIYMIFNILLFPFFLSFLRVHTHMYTGIFHWSSLQTSYTTFFTFTHIVKLTQCPCYFMFTSEQFHCPFSILYQHTSQSFLLKTNT